MRELIASTIFAAVITSSPAWAAEAKVIWQIGRHDRDYHDLTDAGGPNAYRKAFPKDVSFSVGRSDPVKDFSAIHPGPTDEWGDFWEHPFRVTFDLGQAPLGTCELRIDIVDTHGKIPPVLRVEVNGEA
ncbi:unnamed protein product, partial [marine sediment metagenome]